MRIVKSQNEKPRSIEFEGLDFEICLNIVICDLENIY
jgi:hypothetical protein